MQFKRIRTYIAAMLMACVVCQANANDSVYVATIGLSVGTDIGGAVPYPLSNTPSPINAYPQLKPGIGARFALSLIKNWSLGAEINYKNIGMKADARVENQKFRMDDSDVYFTGSAKMEMSFAMLEVPVYVKYQFKKGKDKVMAGFYYSHTFSGNFETTPQKGYIGPEPNKVDIMDMSGVVMNFDDDMDSWDIGFLLGYERKIIDRLNLGIRFSMGFKDIFKPSCNYFEYSMLPMRGSVSISYDLVKTKQLFSAR